MQPSFKELVDTAGMERVDTILLTALKEVTDWESSPKETAVRAWDVVEAVLREGVQRYAKAERNA